MARGQREQPRELAEVTARVEPLESQVVIVKDSALQCLIRTRRCGEQHVVRLARGRTFGSRVAMWRGRLPGIGLYCNCRVFGRCGSRHRGSRFRCFCCRCRGLNGS